MGGMIKQTKTNKTTNKQNKQNNKQPQKLSYIENKQSYNKNQKSKTSWNRGVVFEPVLGEILAVL